ncbi:MAG: 50S ribosomal protein L5 [Candidatus Nanohaloarchaea archaeon]|nr:50S ribosomal protein L5 [Candidatus Nanohaloarchaea archaeon]
MNEMEQIQIHKVTVNIGIGEVGDDVEKAVNLLERMTDSTAVRTESGPNSTGFGLRDGLNIGAKTTIRGEKARDFLGRMFDAIEENISMSNFDKHGNFSFGVEEYINVPGMEYDPDIGMRGFEVAVTLERPGYRVKRRKEDPRDVGKEHRITPEEAVNFVQEQFGAEIEGA